MNFFEFPSKFFPIHKICHDTFKINCRSQILSDSIFSDTAQHTDNRFMKPFKWLMSAAASLIKKKNQQNTSIDNNLCVCSYAEWTWKSFIVEQREKRNEDLLGSRRKSIFLLNLMYLNLMVIRKLFYWYLRLLIVII